MTRQSLLTWETSIVGMTRPQHDRQERIRSTFTTRHSGVLILQNSAVPSSIAPLVPQKDRRSSGLFFHPNHGTSLQHNTIWAA